MIRKGYVYVCDAYAGIIEENDNGYVFTYDDNYFNDTNTKSISLTMSKTKKTYESNVLFAFFDGLIPEGWLLNVVTNNWKININDRFSLLLASCADPIGNVSIRSELV